MAREASRESLLSALLSKECRKGKEELWEEEKEEEVGGEVSHLRC